MLARFWRYYSYLQQQKIMTCEECKMPEGVLTNNVEAKVEGKGDVELNFTSGRV